MWLEIGKIVAPQGLKGEVRVYPNSDFPERFIQPGRRWLLRPGMSEPQPVELLRGHYLEGKGLYIVRLQGIATREQAEALRNSQILAPESDRLPLEPDEFHVADLIDLRVIVQSTQTTIGKVAGVLQAGNDLLEVELDQPQAVDSTSPAALDSDSEAQAPSQKRRQSKKHKRTKSKTQSKSLSKVLIPFVKEIVPIVDLEQGRLEITPPSGLIDEM